MSSFWLKTAALIAPKATLRRLQAMHAIERYAGATIGRRASSFQGRSTSANTEIGSKLLILRDRSRELVRDHWAFQRILDITVGHAVGSGINILPDNGSDRLDKKIALAFEQWVGQADITGEHDLHGVIALALRGMLEGGDMILRLMDMDRNDKRVVPLALQLLEGDFIDHTRNGRVSGIDSRLGVGIGPLGQRTGYWLHKEHPGEAQSLSESYFLDRKYCCHLYKGLRAGQVRGVPVFTPVLMSARDHGDLMDAVIVKAKIEACFTGFITKTGEMSPFDSSTSAEGDRLTTELSPGMLVELADNQDIKFADPSSGGNSFEAIHNATLYAMASGAGVTFDQLTGDLRQANYSSLRAGKIEFRRLIEQLQWLTLMPKLITRITDKWVESAIVAGLLRPKQDGYRWKYITPANEPIDPLKDLNADVVAVRSGRMSPQEFVAGWGRDWKNVVADHASFFKLVDELGITLDIDPRKVNQKGSAQAATANSEEDVAA